MTVSTEVSSISYAGDDLSTVFTVPFRFLADADVQVRRRAADGSVTLLTTGYSLSGAGSATGTCTFSTAPASGTHIVITRAPQILQPGDFTANDRFPAETVELLHDRQTFISQHLRELIRHSISVPFGDAAAASMTLPDAPSRADKYLHFDSNGAPEPAELLVSGTTLSRSVVGQLLHPVYGGEITESITPTDYGVAVANVLRYGAVRTAGNTTDSSAAFLAAWAAIKETGGVLIVPPGDYYLDATWLLDVDLTAPRNYAIYAYGATIRSGPNVTGFAVQVYKGYNYGGVTIRGLRIDHRGNATAAGGIQLKGALSAHLQDIDIEMHGNAATWTGYELAASTPGDGATHSFWAVLDQCSTRKRSGADGGAGVYSYCGINLKGQANAAVIRACRLNSVTHAVLMETDGVVQGFANGAVIRDTAFEGVTNGITINTDSPATLMPAGLRITDNRIESATTFVNVTGAAINDHSHPPILRDNYVNAGSVTNTLVNPNGQRFRVDEPSYYGLSDYDNIVGGPNGYRVICQGAGKHFRVSNESGNSNYENAHILLGGHHIWVEAATGKLRIKSSAPTADDDGTVVGTQS